MFCSFKKIALSGVVASMLVAGSPASATFWWHGYKPNKQHNAERICKRTIKAMQWRSDKLKSRYDRDKHRISNARYAFLHNKNQKLWKRKFEKCLEELDRPPGAVSRQ